MKNRMLHIFKSIHIWFHESWKLNDKKSQRNVLGISAHEVDINYPAGIWAYQEKNREFGLMFIFLTKHIFNICKIIWISQIMWFKKDPVNVFWDTAWTTMYIKPTWYYAFMNIQNLVILSNFHFWTKLLLSNIFAFIR